MISASCKFKNGYARPVNRGTALWNGSRDEISRDNPQRELDDLEYEPIGTEEVWPDCYDLKGIKVTIEIEEVTKQ